MGSPLNYQAQDFSLAQFADAGKYNMNLWFENDEPDTGFFPVNLIVGEMRGPTLVVFAAIHGDEYEGVQTIIQLFRKLQPNHICGILVMIPVANVSSYFHGSRTSGVDGANLARTFPGNPQGSYTEKLAWFLSSLFIAKADFLLDLHSGGSHYAMPPMVGYYENSEEEAGIKSKAAAEEFGMPVLCGHKIIGPGRTISSAIEYGIPWLYTEGYGGKRIRLYEQQLYEQGVLRLMKHLKMFEFAESVNVETPNSITHRLIGDGNLDKAAKAEQDGFFIPCVKLLDRVEANECIGVIYDWFGAELQHILAEQAGIVLMLRETPYTLKGDGLYLLV